MNENQSSSQTDVLIQAYLDGTATETQIRDLRRWLSESRENMDAFVRQIDVHAALHEEFVEAGSSIPFPAAASRRVSYGLVALAASIVAVVGAWLVWATPASIGRITAAQGGAVIFRGGKSAEVTRGLAVKNGDTIVTQRGATTTVEIGEQDAEVKAFADTSCRMWRKHAVQYVHLNSGKIACDVAGHGGSMAMIVTTPRVRATVTGTRFTVEETPVNTHVEVVEGRVKVARLSDEKEIELAQGETVTAGDSGEFVPGRTSTVAAADESAPGKASPEVRYPRVIFSDDFEGKFSNQWEFFNAKAACVENGKDAGVQWHMAVEPLKTGRPLAAAVAVPFGKGSISAACDIFIVDTQHQSAVSMQFLARGIDPADEVGDDPRKKHSGYISFMPGGWHRMECRVIRSLESTEYQVLVDDRINRTSSGDPDHELAALFLGCKSGVMRVANLTIKQLSRDLEARVEGVVFQDFFQDKPSKSWRFVNTTANCITNDADQKRRTCLELMTSGPGKTNAAAVQVMFGSGVYVGEWDVMLEKDGDAGEAGLEQGLYTGNRHRFGEFFGAERGQRFPMPIKLKTGDWHHCEYKIIGRKDNVSYNLFIDGKRMSSGNAGDLPVGVYFEFSDCSLRLANMKISRLTTDKQAGKEPVETHESSRPGTR